MAVGCGAALGAFVQLVAHPSAVPVMGAVIGGVVFSALPEITHDFLDDHDWHLWDVLLRLRHHETWHARHWREERSRLIEHAISGWSRKRH
jgi:hypothetical protein